MVRLLVVDPAVLDRVSKFCVEAEPNVVKLTHWASTDPVDAESTIAKTIAMRESLRTMTPPGRRWWGIRFETTADTRGV
jgi:hypothetical protein